MGDSTDRPKRPGGPPTGKRPDSGRPAKGAPSSGRAPSGRPNKGGDPKRGNDAPSRPRADGQRTDRPKRDGERPAWKRNDDDVPAWKRSEGGKSAWKRPEGEKPAWKQSEGGKSTWRRPESGKRDVPRSEGGKLAWSKSEGGKPAWKRPEAGARATPRRDGDKPAWQKRDGDKRGGSSRDSRGRRDEPRLWTREGNPARGDSSASARELPEDRDPYGTKSVRIHHDAPEIPEEILPNQLDRVARAQLKTLSKENADEVARHMVMAASLINEDPELAHAHAVSAGRRAGRIAVVRETLAITAYSIGDFALALRELRTYRRISGRDDQLPMMVDCERGLARPEKALELGRSVPRASLPVEVQVELAISMSGARLDLGQMDAALIELQIPQLDPDIAFSWSPALFDAYGTVLEDLGRTEEAEVWFNRSDLATGALSSSDESDDLEIEVFEEDSDDDDGIEHDDDGEVDHAVLDIGGAETLEESLSDPKVVAGEVVEAETSEDVTAGDSTKGEPGELDNQKENASE